MRTFFHYSLLIILALFNKLSVISQVPDCLDETFGTKGILHLDVATVFEQGKVIQYQSDGKIIVAGIGHPGAGYEKQFFLQRYLINGSVDTSFAVNGYWTYESLANFVDLIVLPDDYIYVAAYADINFKSSAAVFKFLPDGTLDQSFGIQGHFTIQNESSPQSLHILPVDESKILAISNENSKIVIARIKENGTLDSTFATNGMKIHSSFITNLYEINKVVIDSSGSVYLGGRESQGKYILGKIKSDGQIDSTFGLNGKIISEYTSQFGTNSIKDFELSDGNIIVLGEHIHYKQSFLVLSKYDKKGGLIKSFGFEGLVIDTFNTESVSFNDIFILKNDELLIAGRVANEMVLMKFLPDGKHQTQYGNNGLLSNSYGPLGFNEIIQLGWNPVVSKIYAVGYTEASYPQSISFDALLNNDADITLMRLFEDGMIDENYGLSGKTSSFVYSVRANAQAFAFQDDGKVILAINTTLTTLIRLNKDGSLDHSFGNFGKITLRGFQIETNNCLAIYDNKIYIAGTSTLRAVVFCLNINGIPDTNFNNVGLVVFPLYTEGKAIAINNDGITVAGSSNLTKGNTHFLISRLLFDGQYDNSFGSMGHSIIPINTGEDRATHLKLRDDGKILVFGTTKIITLQYIVGLLLKSDGSLDDGFGTNGKIIDPIGKPTLPTSILLVDNDRIILTIDGGIIKFTEFGKIDSSFALDGFIESPEIKGLAYVYSTVRNGNNLVIGGTHGLDEIMFTTINSSGKLAAPCNSTESVFHADLIKDQLEDMIDIEFDDLGRLWSFGTKDPYPLDYESQLFMLRFDPLIITSDRIVENFNDQFEIYPNPCFDYFILKNVMDNRSKFRYEICNTFGEVLIPKRVSDENTNIDTSTLSRGCYIVRIYNNGSIIAKKIIKL